MSIDDIVFDEVKYREPKRVRRPDRDRNWACAAYEVPGVDDLPIFLDRGPADAVERHALRDTSVELGGILLGRECVDDQTGLPFVWITEALEAKHFENTQASFTYTHDSWEEITRERDRLHPELDIVGWYHTHPDFGIFLSGHDLFIHRNFFAQPLQVALVVDPIRQARGFFRWREGGLEQVGGYFLTSRRDERVALARLVNDLESIPNAESGGGGLSPRLEAELIAMLSRPHQPSAASAAGQAQAATLFGFVGLLAGAVLVAAAAGFYALSQQFREHGEKFAALERSVGRSDQVQQVALEALLAKDGSGADARKFVDSLALARKDREEAIARANQQETLAGLAAGEVRLLAEKLNAARKAEDEQAEKLKKAEAEASDLLGRAKSLNGELSDYLKSDKGELAARYQTAWYAALVGWAVAILASLALLASWAGRAEDEPTVPPTQAPRPTAPEPPHSIV